MSEHVRLSVAGSLDDSAALGALLDADPDLRGHVRREVPQGPEGALGGGLPELVIALGSSGVATAVASVLMVWLRQRSGAVSVHITQPDGTQLELTAERVRALSSDELKAHVDQLTAQLGADSDVAGT
jgi:Effector Associated Constant Component 1